MSCKTSVSDLFETEYVMVCDCAYDAMNEIKATTHSMHFFTFIDPCHQNCDKIRIYLKM